MKLYGPNNTPQPSPKYAKIASLARAFGAKVRDDDFEQIDAFIDAIQEWEAQQKQKQDFDKRDADFLRALGIESRRKEMHASKPRSNPASLGVRKSVTLF